MGHGENIGNTYKREKYVGGDNGKNTGNTRKKGINKRQADNTSNGDSYLVCSWEIQEMGK